MMRSRRRQRAAIAGFTLIEALAATALMGLIITALATITAQWLPNWNRGFARAQHAELVSIALERLVADLAAAEYIKPNRTAKLPLFDGSEFAVTLVRSAFGPNTRPGLEIVRIAETADRDGRVLARSKGLFTPLPLGVAMPAPNQFTDPVALLRAPYRVSFAYAGHDGVWKNEWRNEPMLPMVVRLTVRDTTSARILSVSTAALVHVELPADCARASDKNDCAHNPGQATDQPEGNAAPQAPPQAAPQDQRAAGQGLL
jgi:general secretion pathway protein J